ncbi:hypothetical protein AAG570_005238 [Ranatra chinensis]|uniref:Uncharacterized protein n=1 Tax=Ranatra chinensis TaxID=642074 RepID=A0ABD0XZW3_9HEMI
MRAKIAKGRAEHERELETEWNEARDNTEEVELPLPPVTSSTNTPTLETQKRITSFEYTKSAANYSLLPDSNEYHILFIGGWSIEGGATSRSRRREVPESQPVSCTPPAPQGVFQHSDLERRRPDAFTPKKPPTRFKQRTAAHHTFGHLPDYTDETESAATLDREALVKMNAHMGMSGWSIEGGATSRSRRREAPESQPVSCTPPAPQGVFQHSDLERRRPDAFTPKKPPTRFKQRTAAHHTFGHLPDYTDETKSAATLDREALVKMNAHMGMSGWSIEGGATSRSRRREAPESQPVSCTPPAPQGVFQHSDLERRRPDAFTPKKPPTRFKQRTAAHHTFGHLPDYTDETESAATLDREALVKMNAHMGMSGWSIEGGATSRSRRREAPESQPVSCTPPAPQGVFQHSDLERRRPDAFTPKKPPTRFKQRTAAHHTFGHLPDYTDETKSAATLDREALVKMNAHMGMSGWSIEGGATSRSRRREAPESQPVSCTPPAPQGVFQHSDLERRRPDAFTPKKPPTRFKQRTAAHHTFGHLPDYTDETESAATLDREALVKMNAHMGMSGWSIEGGATSRSRRREAPESQPVSCTPPAPQGVFQHSDLERRRPDAFTPKKPPTRFKQRTAAHHTFGHLPDYTDETESAATLDREALVKMNAHMGMSGWSIEGGATSRSRRREAPESQPVSCTPPAPQGVFQHSDLERRRPDAFTPKKPPTRFKQRTAAHHTFGHLPDYTDETESAATLDREALVKMNAHMGMSGWSIEGGATSRSRRREAPESQPVSCTPPAPQGVFQHSDLERRRPDAFTPKKPPTRFKQRTAAHQSDYSPGHLPIQHHPYYTDLERRRPDMFTPKKPPTRFKERTAAHHSDYSPAFGHLPIQLDLDYTDETKSSAKLDREELVKMNAHMGYPEQTNIPMPEEHKFLNYNTKRPRRKPTGSMGNSRFLSRRYEPGDTVDDLIKEPMSNSYPAPIHIPMPKEHEFIDYKTKRPRRKPTGSMGNRRFLSRRYEPGDTVDDLIKEPMSKSYPEQTHIPMPEEHKFLNYNTKRPRRKPTGSMGNSRILSTQYEPGDTVEDLIKEPMSNSYPEQTHIPMPEEHKFLNYNIKRPRQKPTGSMGNRRFLSRRYEPGDTVDDLIKEPMSKSYPAPTHIPMPEEHKFLNYNIKRPQQNPTGSMGNRRFLSRRYEPGDTVDDLIKEPMSNSYPAPIHIPMPKEHEFIDYKTKRPRRKPTGSMGNRRFLSRRYEPGDTVDDLIKEPMSKSYPAPTHIPMPEEHKFLNYNIKQPQRNPTGSMGNRRFLSRRYEPGDTVDDLIKEPMSKSYPAPTHIPMPKEHEFIDYKTKRPRRKPTGSMGNRRFLSRRYEPGDTVDDLIKEPMSDSYWYTALYFDNPRLFAHTSDHVKPGANLSSLSSAPPSLLGLHLSSVQGAERKRRLPIAPIPCAANITLHNCHQEKRTIGVSWNDWYSPTYDKPDGWLSSLVRKLPFSFDPKELKIIYPNNKKDTLYTPYNKLKAAEKKFHPLSLTMTKSTNEADSTSDSSKQTIFLSPQPYGSSAKPSCDCCSCAGRQSTLLTTQAGIIEQSSLQHHKGLIAPITITRSHECQFPGFGVSRTPLPKPQTIAPPATPAPSQINPSQNQQQTAPCPNMTDKHGQEVPCPYCNNPIFLTYIPMS